MYTIAAAESFLEQVVWILKENLPIFWYGIQITLLLAIVGTGVGFVIGVLLGGIRAVKVEPKDTAFTRICKRMLHGIVGFYIWFFRGTPMMVQAIFFYYMLYPFLQWTPLIAGCCIISANTGAYMAEIMRSGIQSVDSGQIEGARSLGMTNIQTMIHIVLPEAIRNAFPSIGNELIVNIKDSSVLNVIGVVEVYFQSSSIAGTYNLWMQAFFNTCVIYLLLTSIATWLLARMEKRLHMPKQSHPVSSSMPS